jgi:hypothetical protein
MPNGGKAMGKLYGVPELPPHYLSRAEDLAGLKQKLLAGDGNVGITGQTSAVGVQGMSGIGKTVLAAALARDSEVRQAFPDGIYWLTIGQKPNVLELQKQLLRQLTSSRETLTTVREAKDALREALEGRSALLVIDDAWTIDDADALSMTAPRRHAVLIHAAIFRCRGAGGWHDSKGGMCEAERLTRPKKHEYQTRLQAAARPSRAGPGEAHGARDRGGVHRRARAAAIAARSRAGRNSAVARDHRRHRI